MKIELTSYPGWGNRPCYRVPDFQDWLDICAWMHQNQVEHFLLSSGAGGYTFQVRQNHEWFALKWQR